METAFCTTDDLRARWKSSGLADLLDRDNDAGLDTDSLLCAAVDGANSEVSMYVRRVSILPLQYVPAALREYAVRLAVWNLLQTKQAKLTQDDMEAYRLTVERLEAVGRGEMALPFETRVQKNQTAPVLTVTMDNARVRNEASGGSMPGLRRRY
jgi:phage gp36-like protein